MESILTQEELEAIYSALQTGGDPTAVDDLLLTHERGFSSKVEECWMGLAKSLSPWVEGLIGAVMGVKAIIDHPEFRILDSNEAASQNRSWVTMVLGVGSDFFLAGIELELARRFVERRTGAELGAEDTGDSPRALTRLEYRLIVDVFAALAKKLSDFNSSKAPGSVTKIDPQDFARISGKGPFAEVRLYADSLPNAGLWIRGPAYVFVPVDNGAKARLAKRVHDTRVELTALLGTAKLKVTDVWHLSPGVLIPLDSAVGDPLRVMVGNRHKLEGEPLVSRSNLAVKLIGNRKNGADK